MANKQNAWAVFLIGIALLLWQGPQLGLFSLTGITDGYIFMGKSTITWTEPTNCGSITQNCTVGEQLPTTCTPQPTQSSGSACRGWYDTGQKDVYGCSLYRQDLAYSVTGNKCSSCSRGDILCECSKCTQYCDMRPYGGINLCSYGGMQFTTCTFGNLQPDQTAEVLCTNGYWNWTRLYNYKGETCLDMPTQTASKDDEVKVFSVSPLAAECKPSTNFGSPYGSRINPYSPSDAKLHTKNIRGQNFRTEYVFTSSQGYSLSGSGCSTRTSGAGASLALISSAGHSITIYSWTGVASGCFAATISDTGLFDISPSVIDPNKITITIKGLSAGVFDITGWPDLFVMPLTETISAAGTTGPATLTLNNPRYQPLLSCVKEPDELLALESFSAGQELGIYSTRYAVQKFCLAHPVIVTSPTGSGTTAEPYQTWVEGRTLTVPADQTWTVFYIMKNDGSLPTTCGEDAYNVQTGLCTKVSGIIQICSQGQFDASLGLCVVQPESIQICSEGGRYDVSLNVCVYNPPIQMICSIGNYDSSIGKCIFSPPSEANCPIGTEYDPIGLVCSFIPPTANVCPTGYTYNQNTQRCETTPPSSIICPSGSTFNAATGYCEQFPLRQILCSAYYAYDSILDRCVRNPPSSVLCPADYSYDASSDRCVRFVTTQPICDSEGGTYDSTTGLCYRTVLTKTECSIFGGIYDSTKNICVNTITTKIFCDIDGATYDAVNNLCTKTILTQNICSKGVLSQDGLVCLYSPDLETVCS